MRPEVGRCPECRHPASPVTKVTAVDSKEGSKRDTQEQGHQQVCGQESGSVVGHAVIVGLRAIIRYPYACFAPP